VKRYEGLFILNTAGREEGVKEIVDKVSAEINRLGGRVENVQKMDRRSFSRVSNKAVTAGFYVNIIFEIRPDSIPQLRKSFAHSEEIFRILFTNASAPKVEAAAQ
jgi:ribosomal protein S6